MRLIDADDLILTILTNDLRGDDNVDKAILNAPTVKAISVEWIEKYKRAKGWEVTVTTQNAIDNMLNTWEKENEID